MKHSTIHELLSLAMTVGLALSVDACGPRHNDSSLSDMSPGNRYLSIPKFEVSAAEVNTSLDAAIQRMRSGVAAIVNSNQAQRTYASTYGALDAITHDFGNFASRLGVLSEASATPEVRSAASDASVKAGDAIMSAISLNRDLYLVLAAFGATPEAKALSGIEARMISETLKSYENNGMALDDAGRAQLAALQSQLSDLTTKMSDNYRNDEGILRLTAAELTGMTPIQLAQLDRDAATGDYLVHSAIADLRELILTNAKDPQTRKRLIIAGESCAKASNGPLWIKVLNLRLEIAKLLGFPSWADYKISSNMAKSAANARALIDTINTRLDAKFNMEKQELVDLKRQDLGLGADAPVSIGLEDVRYYINKLLLTRYNVDTEALKAYFPQQAAMRGIFNIYEDLFGVEFDEATPPSKWADEVLFYQIKDRQTGELLGAIYFDLYPRDGKYKHFAMFPINNGMLMADNHYDAPLSAMIGNWPRPTGDQPALWTYEQLTTFAHELGHGMHHVLTKVALNNFAGMNVPQDFVEAPSQAFERWMQDAGVLNRFAAHYQTGAKLAPELVAAVVASKKATSGHLYKRQVGFDYLDLRIHSYTDAAQIPTTPEQLYAVTQQDLATYYPDFPESAFIASFGHLFGGYDAGYYGYAWADVISAEIAQKFRKAPGGFMDHEMGARLRQEILEVGGSRDANDTIRAFLGRDFNTDAFFSELLQ